MKTDAEQVQQLKAALEEILADAKDGCGEFNPHRDCAAWLDRNLRCTDCPIYVIDIARKALEQ